MKCIRNLVLRMDADSLLRISLFTLASVSAYAFIVFAVLCLGGGQGDVVCPIRFLSFLLMLPYDLCLFLNISSWYFLLALMSVHVCSAILLCQRALRTGGRAIPMVLSGLAAGYIAVVLCRVSERKVNDDV